MDKKEIEKRQKENLELIEELAEAVSCTGFEKGLKLKAWNEKVSKRENIWDRLAREKQMQRG